MLAAKSDSATATGAATTTVATGAAIMTVLRALVIVVSGSEV